MSHTVVFKSMRGANFLRFGNEEFVIDFTEGVIGLIGENGTGKSALLDALCICLFNETYRKSTQEHWTNNINGSGLYISTSLETHGSTVDRYIITRKPTARKSTDKLSIYKNDVLLTNISNYQEYIENTILGFNANIFKNSIAVSGGTPFISMTPEDKRKFSDNIFSLKQVKEYKKKSNEALSELNVSKRIIEQEILSTSNKIKEYQNILTMSEDNTAEEIIEIDRLINQTLDSIQSSSQLVTTSQDEIIQINDKIVSCREEISLLENKLVELNASAIYASIAQVNAELEVCKREYKKEITEAGRIAPNVVCNSCGNYFTEEQATTHRQLHESESLIIAERGKALKLQLNELQTQLPTIQEINNSITRIKNEEIASYNNRIFQLKSTISLHSNHIVALNNTINSYYSKKDALSTKEDNSSVRLYAEQNIASANALIESKNAELELNSRKIKAYNYIVNMCSDTGIKKLLLKEFMPILNKLISFYLDKFNLPVTVVFDEYFNHTLSAPKGLGQNHGMLSKGQKTRINIAILFAISDLIKRMGNAKCNIMILDEFADEGLDNKGFAAAVESIRKVADRDNKSIVLITHKQEDVLYDNLNALYEIEVKNSFSVLKQVTSF